MADSMTIQNNKIMPLVDDLRQIINQAQPRGRQCQCRIDANVLAYWRAHQSRSAW
jgi:hypothetical protein